MFYAIYMATRPRGFALVLVPVYFVKHSVSCYIYYIQVWMLTGDKLETATSIGRSSKLISKTQTLFTFKQVR